MPRVLIRSIIAVAVATAAACAADSPDVVAGADDLGHIHDIVELEGDLLIATHSGLYRVDDPTTAVLVGTERHDLMALTADGSALQASGHPDLRIDAYRVEGLPAHLGLAESSDGGRSWRVDPDLLGRIDFHALAWAGDVLFGADTEGRIRARQPDGTWNGRGRLDATDLAVDPTDPNHLLAASGGGLWHSTDGGRTWATDPSAPAITQVEWTADGVVVATTDGDIRLAAEPGATWRMIVAPPVDVETLAIVDGRWLVTGRGGTIHELVGETWMPLYEPTR